MDYLYIYLFIYSKIKTFPVRFRAPGLLQRKKLLHHSVFKSREKEKSLETMLQQLLTIIKRLFKVCMESSKGNGILCNISFNKYSHRQTMLYFKDHSEPDGVLSSPERNLMIQVTFRELLFFIYFYFRDDAIFTHIFYFFALLRLPLKIHLDCNTSEVPSFAHSLALLFFFSSIFSISCSTA